MREGELVALTWGDVDLVGKTIHGHKAEAMCAIDALGIAPMLDEAIEIASRDPLTGEDVHVRLAPDGEGA
jgi:integrase